MLINMRSFDLKVQRPRSIDNKVYILCDAGFQDLTKSNALDSNLVIIG